MYINELHNIRMHIFKAKELLITRLFSSAVIRDSWFVSCQQNFLISVGAGTASNWRD